MKQTPEERREHHQTREDRQRKVYNVLLERIDSARFYRGNPDWIKAKVAVYEREAANLARKLNL